MSSSIKYNSPGPYSQDAFLDNEIDVVCCTETWLYRDRPSSLLNSSGYTVFRLDRSVVNTKHVTKNSGGLCTYFKYTTVV